VLLFCTQPCTSDRVIDELVYADPDKEQPLQEVFNAIRTGHTRAYIAFGLLKGETELISRFASLLLSCVRVTKDFTFTCVVV